MLPVPAHRSAPAFTTQLAALLLCGVFALGLSGCAAPTPAPSATPTETYTPIPPTITPSPTPANPSGKIAYIVQIDDTHADLYLMNGDGSDQARIRQCAEGGCSDPAWSPDGKQLAFVEVSSAAPYGDIYTLGRDGGEASKLTHCDMLCSDLTWSPDGSKIAFATTVLQSTSDLLPAVQVIDADGSNLTTLATSSNWLDSASDLNWSPDGKQLAFTFSDGVSHFELSSVNADGSGLGDMIPAVPGSLFGRWSPDGKQVAYILNVRLYAARPDGSSPHPLSSGDADRFAWSPDGSQIAYLMPSATKPQLMVTNTDGTGSHTVFAGDPTWFCWSPDGQQIAISAWPDSDPGHNVYVVNRDGSGLKELAAGGSAPAWAKP